MTNRLYYGDNLEVLRAFDAESVDLIYLDPPFNSNANYNILFKNPGGGQALMRRSKRSRTPGTGTTRRRMPSTR